jgi:subtilisin family serine protease
VRPKRLPSVTRVLVGFRSGTLGVAAAGSGSYRSLSVARNVVARMQQSAASLTAAFPTLANAELSPAIVAGRFTVKDTANIEALLASLRANPSVEWAERDEVVTIRDGAPRSRAADIFTRFATLGNSAASASAATAASKLPNDPFYYLQSWSANMLDLPRAWTLSTGSSAVTVAVVDMGVRFEHTDIAANFTTDGYDFVSGSDVYAFPQQLCDGGSTFTAINGDNDGPDTDPTDPDDIFYDPDFDCWEHSDAGDHGLWTSSIIGGIGNNGSGAVGVNWSVKIRPIRVLGIDGSGFSFDIAQGILYAAGLPAAGAGGALVQASSRASVINVSLGGYFPSTGLRNAVAAAVAAGSLIVASAGNDAVDVPAYPAAFPNVIGVAALGMDGALATYSNAGSYVSVAAPGGDFRLDDFGGGGVLGAGWDFVRGRANFVIGYGTSAAAPYVSGVAALVLAQNPSMTAAQVRSRIETYATRGPGLSRSDIFGWGIVNAYNAITGTNGPARATYVRLIDATTGAIGRSTTVDANGNFVFTKVANGSYFVQAGDDDSGDGAIGGVGRRFTWAGGFGKPTVFNVNGNSSSAAIVLGTPLEVEPNDDVQHANMLSVGSHVAGSITTPDVRDVYQVQIPVAGTYVFETSGLVGSCGFGLEVDTFLSIVNSTGTSMGTSNDVDIGNQSHFCSRVSVALTPGIYYVTVSVSPLAAFSQLANFGRYRLEVRFGT